MYYVYYYFWHGIKACSKVVRQPRAGYRDGSIIVSEKSFIIILPSRQLWVKDTGRHLLPVFYILNLI
jgi:hypothetical protein